MSLIQRASLGATDVWKDVLRPGTSTESLFDGNGIMRVLSERDLDTHAYLRIFWGRTVMEISGCGGELSLADG